MLCWNKHLIWLKLVTCLTTTNQIALFQHSIVALLLKLFMISTPGMIVLFWKITFIDQLVKKESMGVNAAVLKSQPTKLGMND